MNVQKYLGWAQRFLYQIEQGPLPTPQLTLSIDHDWPIERRIFNFTLSINAGSNPFTIYAPGVESHGLVELATVVPTPFAAFPNTESWTLNYVTRTAQTIPLFFHLAGLATVTQLPLIGGRTQNNVTTWEGIPPVYVGPGDSLQYSQVSVAGGTFTFVSGMVIERLRSYPLRLP